MKVRDLYNVMDLWTHVEIADLDEQQVINGMMVELETGFKEEGCENILFDENMEKILDMKIAEVEALGNLKIRITVL